MFGWPQNGRSIGTESSQLSGEEVFLPTTAEKTFRLKETKMVMYIITLLSNLTFGTIGKAMVVNMTAKAVGKNSSFRISVRII